MKSGKGFDLDDFKAQFQQMRNMGGMSALMDKLPASVESGSAKCESGRQSN